MQISILREKETYGIECCNSGYYKYSVKCNSAYGELYSIDWKAFNFYMPIFNN